MFFSFPQEVSNNIPALEDVEVTSSNNNNSNSNKRKKYGERLTPKKKEEISENEDTTKKKKDNLETLDIPGKECLHILNWLIFFSNW